ncbi:hypothetical protein RBB50_004221 [Rhinocladiella similis]
MASTSAPRANVEAKVNFQATLTYRYRQSDDQRLFKLLDHPGNNRPYNVKVRLDGQLHVWQNYDNYQFKLCYNPTDYTYRMLDEALALPDDPMNMPDTLPPIACLEIELHDDAQPEVSELIHNRRLPPIDFSVFPLKNTFRDMSLVRFTIHDTRVIPNWDRRRVLALLAGATTWSPQTNIKHFVEAERSAIESERAFALQVLKGIDGASCRLWTVPFRGNQILVCIAPPEKNRAINWETVLREGQVIVILGDPHCHQIANSYPNPSRDGLCRARVVHGQERAPVTAILEHTVTGNDIALYSNLKPRDVIINLEIFDETVTRANESLTQSESIFEGEEEVKIVQALLNVSARTRHDIPLQKIFLDGESADTSENSFVGGSDVSIPNFPPELAQMNDAQREVIRNVYRHTVSLVVGPPGCAKTSTAVFTIECLLKDFPWAKALICAPTNGAVHEIGLKLQSRRALAPTSLHFIHLTSWAHSEARLAQHLPLSPNNLLEVCYNLACGEFWNTSAEFRYGYEKIRDEGALRDRRALRRYEQARYALGEQALTRARIVICTCCSAALKLLVTNYRPSLLILDEAACAHPYELMIPMVKFFMTLKRVVFLGDPKQFPPYASTPESKKWWQISIFEKMQQKGFKCVVLSVSYRAHSALVEHTSRFFYDGKLSAAREYPSRSMNLLLNQFTVGDFGTLIDVNGHTTQLSNFTHFISVDNSYCQTSDTMSSENRPEAQCVEALIKVLVGRHGLFDPSEVMCITGYRDQLRVLKRQAKDGAYSSDHLNDGVDIRTIHLSQGRENAIVILTLVRTMTEDGDRSLLKSMMVNTKLLNVALSRAKDGLYIVGHWPSIVQLPENELLRRILTDMASRFPRFVISAGRSPICTEFENTLDQTVPRLIRANAIAGREEVTIARRQLLEAEFNQVRDDWVWYMDTKYGFPAWLGARERLRASLHGWREAKNGRIWNPEPEFFLRRTIYAAVQMRFAVRHTGYANEDEFRRQLVRYDSERSRAADLLRQITQLRAYERRLLEEEMREDMQMEGLME